MLKTIRWSIIIAAILGVGQAAADVRLPALCSDHMVLQANVEVPIWGWAEPGETVTVAVGDRTGTATADGDGRWLATLEPLPGGGPLELIVRGKNELVVRDVLVGEVWLCSGQSNMAMAVRNVHDAEREIAAAKFPRIRVFQVARRTALTPQNDCTGNWEICSPETAEAFSAMAYFFGRELHQTLKTPVGLIVSAYSGSAIEAWTSLDAQRLEPALRELLNSWEQKDAAYTEDVARAAQAEYERLLADWRQASRVATTAGQTPLQKPRPPRVPQQDWHHPAVLFNGMMAPLIPYRIRGCLWYQGETNAASEASSALYELQLPLLVNDWRRRWGQGDFPFAWVQLPLISAQAPHWARIRESMLEATSLPNSGMVVTYDLGEQRLLHPKNKQAFAHRLALWARATVYGEDVVWSGPLPASHDIEGSEVRLRFRQSDGGLHAKDGPLRGFAIAGSDRVWHTAQARIEGEGVIVWHPEVPQPTAVRFGWSNQPDANLFNGAGLPASPFRTDDW